MEPSKPVSRRVWRMTAACPRGEFIEVTLESAKPEGVTVSAPLEDVHARVLDPGKAPTWESSSYDLLTGLTVRDVTDTIPGRIFDEVFRDGRPLSPRKLR